ncbi:DEAD/DEAH box helicase [Hoyosella sp. YIM 151337]|uniref:DEAD/DEAH box helicase n=1 Tax=Hoyosella sp. YIM 151337 TaxID=2992742 RepID=UPI00223587E5|nr:DEAD/DEAH box helicase [Hoyosella sp. YIM 151337]MCW4352280.1 DEAD/DEAH box helicase [Hoyosella sp. YIM 151337]
MRGATTERQILSKFTKDTGISGPPGGSSTGKTVTADARALTEPHESPTFAELGVLGDIVRALNEQGIERTFAIQELTLPLALAGDDLIGQARTGMGKTFGFGVPLLHRVAAGAAPLNGTPRALVVVPTRELCIQVTKDLTAAGRYLRAGADGAPRPLSVQAIYGGRPYEEQTSALESGVDVVVGTPGRLLDLANQKHLRLTGVSIVVLDEADEMLDLGFLPDIEKILSRVPDERQTMLFSATMPGPIITLARTFLNQPTHVRAEEADSSAVHDRTRQFVYRAHALDKLELVCRALQARDRGAAMLFTRTKRQADQLARDLEERGFAVCAVHGDLGQAAREKSLRRFRSGRANVLVATDVAARGIDIEDVTHVVNYQCPDDENTYVHRVGRTGRAGRTGTAVTLVDWEDLDRWKHISQTLGIGIDEPTETYSTSPHLYSDLDIPEDVTGRVASPTQEGEAVAAESADAKPDKRAARGKRRRTRGGKSTQGGNLDAEAPDTAPGLTSAPDSPPGPAVPSGPGGPSGPKEGRTQRRRKRTRRGAPSAADDAGKTDSTVRDSHAAPQVSSE